MFTYSCSGPVCQVSGNNPHQLNSSVQILKDALRLTFCQIQNSNLYTPDLRVFKWAVKFFPQQVIYIQEELAYRGSLSISLMQCFSTRGNVALSPPPGDICLSGDVFFVAVGGCYLASSRWKPRCSKTSPTTKNHPAQAVNSPEVKKLH